MAIIVENGTGVANANSYVTRAESIVYAADRGVVLPDTIATDAKIIRAMDYLQAQIFKGNVTSLSQSLEWPRSNVIINGSLFASNAIPVNLKKSQMQLVIEQVNGIDIMPTISGGFVKREKVGPIETEYSESFASDNGLYPNMPIVDALLALLLANGGGFSLTTYRV